MILNISVGLLGAAFFAGICALQKHLGFFRSPIRSFLLGLEYTHLCNSFLMWFTTLVVFLFLVARVRWVEDELSHGVVIGTQTRLGAFIMGQLLGGLWFCACLAWESVF